MRLQSILLIKGESQMTQTIRIDTSTLSNLSRSLIGFDRMFNDISRLQVRTDNYPPHNIIKTGENSYVIEMAVAGFSKDELEIEVESNQLSITGQKSELVKKDGEQEPVYLHRGLASRDFIKIFPLAEHVQVGDASLTNGILSVKLTRIVPEALKHRVISIKD